MSQERQTSRRRGLRCSAQFALAVLVGTVSVIATNEDAAPALPAGCTQSGLTVTCTYTSGTNEFVVPNAVTSIHVVAVGGAGACGMNLVDECTSSGGFGARVTADLTVTPGGTLFAAVGGNAVGRTGGANGGGTGATFGDGGGGGASDVRTSEFVAQSRLLVAGGGGGGGRFNGGGNGGGGIAGLPGAGGVSVTDAAGGGGGAAGTQVAGGAGGIGGSGATKDGGSGGPGSVLQGGDGAPVVMPFQACAGFTSHGGGGGGGGGGLYGGGGGGAGGADCEGEDHHHGGNGGGGGGSSLVPDGGTVEPDWTGVPKIEISYTTPLVVTPTALDFGTQPIGSTSAAKSVTLAVTGPAAIHVNAVSVGGADASDFAVASDTCSGQTIAAGTTCTVGVTFSPTATGARAATLSIADDGPDSPQAVTLAGLGTTLADVRVAISGPSSARTNSQNTYAVTVASAGPSTARGVVLTAQIPRGTKFVGVSTTHGTCTAPRSGSTSGAISCSLGDLVSGESAVSSVTFKVALTGKGGSVVTVAQAYSTGSGATPDPDLANNVASFSTSVTR